MRKMRRLFRRLFGYKLIFLKLIALVAIVVNTAVVFNYAIDKLGRKAEDTTVEQVEQVDQVEQEQATEPPAEEVDEQTADAQEVVELEMVIIEQPPADDEPTEEPVEETPSYTAEDLELLALVIYQEAGADKCSDDVRLMVGTVVMNRVADDRFPNTIYEVVTQRSQYGRLHWTGPIWPERASTDAEAHAVKRAYECAERVLNGERLLPADVVWQSEYIQGTEIVVYQEGFYFCR